MPSTFTTYNRFTKQATGENTNTWGLILNVVLDLIDYAIAGVLAISMVGATTLTSVNGATDQARAAVINYTGASAGTLTVPSTAKTYWVRAATAPCTITNGSNSVTVAGGDFRKVVTNGSSVWIAYGTDYGANKLTNVGDPTQAQDASTKAYVDAQVSAMGGTGIGVPSLTGNRGRPLTANNAETALAFDTGGTVKSANFAAVPGGKYLVDTSGGPVTATMWATPNDGDVCWFKDAAQSGTGWFANNLTIARNGSNIRGLASDLVCNVAFSGFGLSAVSSNFRIVE